MCRKKIRKYENTIITTALIVSLIGSLLMMYLFLWHHRDASICLSLDTDATGDYGSFVGGVIGTILSILLLYLTFRLQREDSENNARVYENQILNDEFFHMLDLYNDIAERFEYYNANKAVFNKGKDALKSLLLDMFDNYDANTIFNQRRKVAQNEYMIVIHEHYDTAAVYFRTIYRIYQIIDEAQCEELKKVEYAKIMRAQLTSAELVMLRYNALTLYGVKSKLYLNKYNVLKHIQPFDLLEMKKWRLKLNARELSLANMTLQNVRFLAKDLLDDKSDKLCRSMNERRYKLRIETNEGHSSLLVNIEIDNTFIAPKYSQFVWLDNYTPEELEDMMYYFFFDIVSLNNFNQYNKRSDLHYQHMKIVNPSGHTTITVSVVNKYGNKLRLSN